LILTDFEEDIAVCLILEEVLVFTNIYVFHCPVDLDLCLKLLKIEEEKGYYKYAFVRDTHTICKRYIN